MTSPMSQVLAEDAVFGQLGAAREQDGEDDEDGDGADVNENLREAGELRVERKEEECEAAEGHRDGEGAWTRFFKSTAASPPARVRAAIR